MIKGLKKILKIKSRHKYFSVTYICIWPRFMTKTIVKINKTTTILNNFSNCYFSVILKTVKLALGLKTSCLAKKNRNLICPKGQAKQKSQ